MLVIAQTGLETFERLNSNSCLGFGMNPLIWKHVNLKCDLSPFKLIISKYFMHFSLILNGEKRLHFILSYENYTWGKLLSYLSLSPSLTERFDVEDALFNAVKLQVQYINLIKETIVSPQYKKLWLKCTFDPLYLAP